MIDLLERIIFTHPVWFLSDVNRSAAMDLLEGHEPGCFIVRSSSKQYCMAISVRLPEDKGPYVEHYLIEISSDGTVHLEDSQNTFKAVPFLVAHYSQCCDELPVQLTLPKPLNVLSTRQDLSHFALQGKDFWKKQQPGQQSNNNNNNEEPEPTPAATYLNIPGLLANKPAEEEDEPLCPTPPPHLQSPLPESPPPSVRSRPEDSLSDDSASTVFSEPWDHYNLDRLLNLVCVDDSEEELEDLDKDTTLGRKRLKSFQDRLDNLCEGRRGRNRSMSIRENISAHVLRLSQKKDNTFSKAIENFISCTRESPETNPTIIMRNIRQFMTGIKNYLIQHGEEELNTIIESERNKLNADEFLNIDAILECALHSLVIKPLKGYLHNLFISYYTKNGSWKRMSENITYGQTLTPLDLGIKTSIEPPPPAALDQVQHYLSRLQHAYSPQAKLEHLLSAISIIYRSVQKDKILGADDFLPVLVYVLAQCGFVGAELEADYMWGLLHPSLLTGEGGYYLTTLMSAVEILKSLLPHQPQSLQEGFIKVLLPNEESGNILTLTFPVGPNTTHFDLVKMIAHKFQITNPQDYTLSLLVGGEEKPCQGKLEGLTQSTFTFKPRDMKVVWPLHTEST